MLRNFPWPAGSLIRRALLQQIFLINPIIATIIFTFFALTESPYRFEFVLITFIITEFIGTAIAIPTIIAYHWLESANRGARLLFTVIIILVFGNLGSVLALFFLDTGILNVNVVFFRPELLWFNFGMAIIFGSGQIGFILLRQRLERQRDDLQRQKVEEEKAKTLQKSSELQALRSRIDPHFLFNTLNSIASLIRSNPEQAESMVERLAGLFRYTLYADDENLVPLEKEITLIQKYLAIEKVRLGGRLRYRLQIPAQLNVWLIPPLLLQPLIENSIKHGIGELSNGGEIVIEAKKSDHKLTFVVSNPVPKRPRPSSGGGFGQRSVAERLLLLYGERATFSTRCENDRYIAHIQIPLPEKRGQ
jgi:sensor histidine kinase YesM